MKNNIRILIVEDDIISKNLMLAILNPYAECDVANNGKEAMEKFKEAFDAEKPFDLMCLDIMMPEKNGHEVLKEVREYEEQKGISNINDIIKIIMTTALSDFKNVAEAFKSQCEGYLVKPIRKEKLLKTIQELFPTFEI